jgi:ubiquinone/menaquinone biosynthesis C-methylase UbiE
MKKQIYDNTPVVGRLRTCIELVKEQNISGKVILDIGCSNGLLAYYLLREKPKKYIGVDPNLDSISIAKKNNRNGAFIQSTADNLPVKDKIADIVLIFDVIEHVPVGTELETLQEVNRVLKKNATLLLSTPNDNFFTNLLDPAWYLGHRHYKQEIIEGYLKEAGFSIKFVKTKGGIWFSVYLIWLYIMKWIFKSPYSRNKLLENLDDKQFSKEGIHTIFVVAKKS